LTLIALIMYPIYEESETSNLSRGGLRFILLSLAILATAGLVRIPLWIFLFMKPKKFNNPLDQGVDKFESTIVAFAAGFASMGAFYLSLGAIISHGELTSLGLAGIIFLFPAIFAAILGGFLYRETVYRVGRNGWLPRLLLDGMVILAFYLIVHKYT
jgi:hypothetical protein